MDTAAIEKSAVCGEKSDTQGSKRSTRSVYGDRSDRIVDLYYFIKEFYGKYNQDTCKQSDKERADRCYLITACGDRYQTCKRSV